MANSNLSNAKNAKNDEFYTQYGDIQKEINAYIDYDPNVFRGKVVYCNCDDPFESNFFKYFANKFKEYALKKLITTSYVGSPIVQTQIQIPGFEETGKEKTLPDRKNRKAFRIEINEVSDLTKDGIANLDDVKWLLEHDKNASRVLQGNDKYPAGDFRSKECIELLKEADIVVTNPPFSLYRKYVEQLIKYNKKFVIIGSKNSITNKEIFPLIKDNKMWVGTTSFNKDMLFIAPANADLNNKPKTAIRRVDGITYLRSPSVWFTNLDHGRRHQPLKLMTTAENFKYNKKLKGKDSYEWYDNYDAIEVSFTDAIPSDYKGVMGVPISFLDKYSPEQFEIIWQASGNTRASAPKDVLRVLKYHSHPEDRGGCGIINGRRAFSRVLIRHKKK